MMMRSIKISVLVLVVLVVGIMCTRGTQTSASPILASPKHSSAVDSLSAIDAKSPVSDTIVFDSSVYLPLLISSPAQHTIQWDFATIDRGYDTIDENVSSVDMVLDSQDSPRIAYEIAGGSAIRYARLTEGQWTTETVASAEMGANLALALSSDDVAHISYSACGPFGCAYRYAEQIGTGWVITEGLDGQGALAVDPAGNPHMGYAYGNLVGDITVRYDYRVNGNWITTTVAGPADDYRGLNLKLDDSGFAHMTYSEYVQSDEYYAWFDIDGSLNYARWNGSTWIVDIIDDDIVDESAKSYHLDQCNALALDPNGYAHIGYYDRDENKLKYAFESGSGWITETVDTLYAVSSIWTWQHVAIALDADDQPHLVYYDQDEIKYARRTGGQWVIETLTDHGEWNPSIAIDAQNRIHIVFSEYDEQGPALMYGLGEF